MSADQSLFAHYMQTLSVTGSLQIKFAISVSVYRRNIFNWISPALWFQLQLRANIIL